MLSGNEKEFDYFVKKYYPQVLAQCLRYTQNMDEAEDFVQEAFLIAYEKLSTFKGESKFSSWLYSITQNLLLMKSRNEKKSPCTSLENLDTFSQTETSPEKEVLEQDFKTFFHSLISRLPQVYRVPIQLHYFEGLSYSEISAKLNIKLNTLKSHILRGKDLLKTWLEKENLHDKP
ncbi:MAG: RNA polymerase sigma factor [Leptospiraceae bacterium]|nr:RNA polymerase sigma factor [Leptospiraceae bacterium]